MFFKGVDYGFFFYKRFLKIFRINIMRNNFWGKKYFVLWEFIVIRIRWYYMGVFSIGRGVFFVRSIFVVFEFRIWIEI